MVGRGYWFVKLNLDAPEYYVTISAESEFMQLSETIRENQGFAEKIDIGDACWQPILLRKGGKIASKKF